VECNGKSVLEVGSGPGGNLFFLSGKGCQHLTGVDISAEMVRLSQELLKNKNISVSRINGTSLPFENHSFEIVFTSTVLQHNTDDNRLRELVSEICRVSARDVIIFERIEKSIRGHESNLGRPVSYYTGLFGAHDFQLVSTTFLKVRASYFTCGAIRKMFNRRSRKEGEPVSRMSYLLEEISLPITRILDPIIPTHSGVAMMHFERKDHSNR
jgi:ubiquinone/menaquinone biosynthesis C-methylase UbiE